MSLAGWIGAAFVLGLIVGGGAVALMARSNDAEARLRRLRREFDRYQQEVADHYGHTAELLTRVRGGFAQLYQHVEQGAAELVSEDALQRRLRQLEKDTGGGRAGAGGRPRLEAEPAAGATERADAAYGAGSAGPGGSATERRAPGQEDTYSVLDGDDDATAGTPGGTDPDTDEAARRG